MLNNAQPSKKRSRSTSKQMTSTMICMANSRFRQIGVVFTGKTARVDHEFISGKFELMACRSKTRWTTLPHDVERLVEQFLCRSELPFFSLVHLEDEMYLTFYGSISGTYEPRPNIRPNFQTPDMPNARPSSEHVFRDQKLVTCTKDGRFMINSSAKPEFWLLGKLPQAWVSVMFP